MRFTVAELRKNIRVALNAVERGEDVYITRHNKTFAIIKSPVSFLSTGEASINIRPDFAKGKDKGVEVVTRFEKGVNTVISIDGKPPKKSPGASHQFTPPEHPCCEKQKPCKHWQYDDVRQVWVNSVSGRERGVE